LEYLIARFPDIEPRIWQQRIEAGKVHWHDGTLIWATTEFKPQQRVYYYRETEREPHIPFSEEILFQDEHILAAYKPHFLPVTPGGVYVNECLQHRLRDKTSLDDLQALHRLDRATAGLVLFSTNTDTRQHYHNLFATQQIHKTYQAIAKTTGTQNLVGQKWEIKNRLLPSSVRFRMEVVEGEANSESLISCKAQQGNLALFELKPVTGKTHQLRVHMQSLGYSILHDRYYPLLQAESADDFDKPLQLLAKELRFVDPVTGEARIFECDRELSLDGNGIA